MITEYERDVLDCMLEGLQHSPSPVDDYNSYLEEDLIYMIPREENLDFRIAPDRCDPSRNIAEIVYEGSSTVVTRDGRTRKP